MALDLDEIEILQTETLEIEEEITDQEAIDQEDNQEMMKIEVLVQDQETILNHKDQTEIPEKEVLQIETLETIDLEAIDLEEIQIPQDLVFREITLEDDPDKYFLKKQFFIFLFFNLFK